jgi:hypothetical protein
MNAGSIRSIRLLDWVIRDHLEGQSAAREGLPGPAAANVSGLSGLVGPHMAWWGVAERFMACERSGVRIPIAPPQVRYKSSNTEPASNRPVKGIPRGKIRPWDGCPSSSRVKSDQVG